MECPAYHVSELPWSQQDPPDLEIAIPLIDPPGALVLDRTAGRDFYGSLWEDDRVRMPLEPNLSELMYERERIYLTYSISAERVGKWLKVYSCGWYQGRIRWRTFALAIDLLDRARDKLEPRAGQSIVSPTNPVAAG